MPDDQIARELKAAAQGDYRHAYGWLGECAREEWSRKKAEYNRTYRLRHPERLHALRPIYKQREKAKKLGLEQFPLPRWDKESQSLEIELG